MFEFNRKKFKNYFSFIKNFIYKQMIFFTYIYIYITVYITYNYLQLRPIIYAVKNIVPY